MINFMWVDEWLTLDKTVYDGINKLIYVADNVTDLHVADDIYSRWKDWAGMYEHMRYEPAMEAIGGNDLPGGNKLGTTIFLINNWKIVVDHKINFNGNIYSDDGSSPYITVGDNQLSTTKVSNLIEKIAPDDIDIPIPPTAAENAAEVRIELSPELLRINKDLLTTKRFVSLTK